MSKQSGTPNGWNGQERRKRGQKGYRGDRRRRVDTAMREEEEKRAIQGCLQHLSRSISLSVPHSELNLRALDEISTSSEAVARTKIPAGVFVFGLVTSRERQISIFSHSERRVIFHDVEDIEIEAEDNGARLVAPQIHDDEDLVEEEVDALPADIHCIRRRRLCSSSEDEAFLNEGDPPIEAIISDILLLQEGQISEDALRAKYHHS